MVSDWKALTSERKKQGGVTGIAERGCSFRQGGLEGVTEMANLSKYLKELEK